MTERDEVSHHPTYLRSRGAHWFMCSCGTRGENRRTATGSQLTFGAHLIAENLRGDM